MRRRYVPGRMRLRVPAPNDQQLLDVLSFVIGAVGRDRPLMSACFAPAPPATWRHYFFVRRYMGESDRERAAWEAAGKPDLETWLPHKDPQERS